MSLLYRHHCKKRDLAIRPSHPRLALAFSALATGQSILASVRLSPQLQATLFGLSRDNSRQVPIPTVSLLFLYPVTSAYSLFQQPWQTERITFTRQNSPNKPKDTMVRKCHLNVKSRKKDEVSYLLCVCGFAQHFPGKIEKIPNDEVGGFEKKALAFDRLDVLTYVSFLHSVV